MYLGTVIVSAILLIGLAATAIFITVGIFLVKALNRYIKTGNIKEES